MDSQNNSSIKIAKRLYKILVDNIHQGNYGAFLSVEKIYPI